MRNTFSPRPALLALLPTMALVVASGCQSTREWFASWRGPQVSALATSEPETAPVANLSAQQRADMQFTLGRISESRGESDAAIQAYRATLQEDPTRHDAAWRLAVMYDRQGKSADAEPLFRQAIQGLPQNADLHSDFGYSLSLQSRWQESEQMLRHAIAIHPQHIRAHNNLGVVLAGTGRVDEALREFERAGCAPSVCHANLAYGLALQGQLDAARQHYHQALALDPQSAAAQRGLRQLDAAIVAINQGGPPTTTAARTSTPSTSAETRTAASPASASTAPVRR